MSHRQRKTRRRKRHGGGSKVLLGLGVVATLCVIAVLSAAGYVLAIAEVDKEGVRLSANTWAERASERGPTAAKLRQVWLRRLREHGLSSTESP